jgi:hypothetical protein
MEIFGNNSAEQPLSEYKQPEIPESVWRSLAQQKTTAGAKGMQALGEGVSSLGHAVGGYLKKEEAEDEASGEQNISFMRNSEGNLVPTSAGDGGFLFGANGPSAMPTSDGVTNLFNSVFPEQGSAEAIGPAAAKDGSNVAAMTNMMNVSSVQAANVVLAGEIQAMRQKYEGNPEAFKQAFFPYAQTLRDSMPGKAGQALYNAAFHLYGQHMASMVSNKFTQNKNEAWDTIEAGIKRDMMDTMSFARQFPGSFDELKKHPVYQKVITGYSSLNGNPIFSGRMTGGKMQEATYDFEQDILKSWAIGHAERLRDQPGGSADAAQAWAIKEFHNKGRDDIFNAVDSHILWKSEAQKDAVQANNAVVDKYTSAYMSGQQVPDSSEADWAIRNSEKVGDFMGAERIRAARKSYNAWKNTAGAPLVNRIQSSMGAPSYPGQTIPSTALPNLDNNFNEAIDKLGLNAQEQFYYNTHRRNFMKGGVKNPDGSVSTVVGGVHNIDGREYLLPSVWDGQIHKNRNEIIDHAKKVGLSNYPNYATADEALKREKAMHDYMEKDVAAVKNWHNQNPNGKLQDHADDASQQNANVYLFGSRGRGVGAINLVYKGSLDQADKGNVSPNQFFSYLKSIGASDNEGRLLTGAGMSESGLNPNAVHDGGTGYGLFGHKHSRIDMRGRNWQEQARLALNELRSRPEHALVEAAKGPDDLAIAQMHYEQPQGYSKAHPENGHNFTGRRNTLARLYGLNGGQEVAQIAAPGDVRTGSRRFSDAEYSANPYLAVADLAMRQQQGKFEVAQMQQSLPLMAAAARQGMQIPEPVIMRAQQLVDEHPEELGKHWQEFEHAYTAHPVAAQIAGTQDPEQHLRDLKNQAVTTGDFSKLAFADEMEKQVHALQQDFKDNPQRAAARPDVGILQRQPPDMAQAFETNNAPEAFQTIMKEKRDAGNAITNRFGGDRMNNTIMGSDVKGIVNKLANTDANGVTNVLTTMQGGMTREELRSIEQNKDFTGAINGLSYSDDIGKARAAMGYLDARWRDNPEEFNATFPKMRERLVAWQRNTQFKGEAFAQKMQQRALDPNEQAAMDANKSLAHEELKKMKPQDALAGLQHNILGFRSFDYTHAKQAMDSDRFSAKDVAWQDFQERYTGYRVNGVDAAAARDAAVEDLQFKWNTSELNGGRFMAYPPEMNGHYAPINGSTQWVTDQLRDTISEISDKNKLGGLYWNPEGKNSTFGRDYETALVSDKTTQAEWANGVPSYRILVKNAEGNFIPLMSKNSQGQMVEARFYADRQKALQEAKSGFWIERNRQGFPGEPTPPGGNPGTVPPGSVPPSIDTESGPETSGNSPDGGMPSANQATPDVTNPGQHNSVNPQGPEAPPMTAPEGGTPNVARGEQGPPDPSNFDPSRAPPSLRKAVEKYPFLKNANWSKVEDFGDVKNADELASLNARNDPHLMDIGDKMLATFTPEQRKHLVKLNDDYHETDKISRDDEVEQLVDEGMKRSEAKKKAYAEFGSLARKDDPKWAMSVFLSETLFPKGLGGMKRKYAAGFKLTQEQKALIEEARNYVTTGNK